MAGAVGGPAAEVAPHRRPEQLRNEGLSPLFWPTQHPDNPVVFLDVGLKGAPLGRMYIELFAHLVPRTAENMRQFCTGEHVVRLAPQGYKGSPFHRVIKGFMVQGGDFVRQNGTGRTSIYGARFEDEAAGLKIPHDAPGLVSMANSGPNTNGCQFFITCAPTPWLDGKHVVCGKLLREDSMLVLRKIENVECDSNDKPKLPLTILNCGQM